MNQQRWWFLGVLGLTVALASCQGLPSGRSQQPIEPVSVDSLDSQVIQSLVEAIAQTEVDLILKQQQFTIDSPQIAQLQEQRKQLLERLVSVRTIEPFSVSDEPKEIELNQDLKTALDRATREAIAAQIIDLELQYAKTKTQYDEHHPLLIMIREQLRSLRVNYQQASNVLVTQIAS